MGDFKFRYLYGVLCIKETELQFLAVYAVSLIVL